MSHEKKDPRPRHGPRRRLEMPHRAGARVSSLYVANLQRAEDREALNQLFSFVMKELPLSLDEGTEKLPEVADKLARSLEFLRTSKKIIPAGGVTRILFNLKMIETAIIHSNQDVPQSLSGLIDYLAEPEEVSGLTYEDVVFTNDDSMPFYSQSRHDHGGSDYVLREHHGKIRTFTTGAVGLTEANFYAVHRKIEGLLGDVISDVLRVMTHLRKRDSESIIPGLVDTKIPECTDIKVKLEEILKYTESLGDMPPGHFAAFRKFLVSHPIRGFKGPSGAFTAKIPTLELLFRGDLLNTDYYKYLKDNIRYFPERDRDSLLSAQNGPSLNELYQRLGKPKEVYPILNLLDNFFREFRATHYRAVASQVPEAIKGNTSGTGGEQNPGEFLRSRMRQQKPETPD